MDGRTRISDFSYEGALKAAGHTVHVFQLFGSYQGSWWAKVTSAKGEHGWVGGYYGSCSGCDAIQAQFGWGFGEDDPEDWDSKWLTPEEHEQWIDFGKSEATMFYTQEEAEAKAGENIEWDFDAKEELEFIQKHSWR